MTKKILLAAFDIRRDSDPDLSLSIGYLHANLSHRSKILIPHEIDALSININDYSRPINRSDIDSIIQDYAIMSYDIIALGSYIWSSHIVKITVGALREKGFKGKIILGGYEIDHSADLEKIYPGVDVFIGGYAEDSLADVINDAGNRIKYISKEPDFEDIVSPYISGSIPIKYGQKKLRIETKRGCPFKCSFCAHRDLKYSKIYYHSLQNVFDEIDLVLNRNVLKLNIIDPVFNFGSNYNQILKYIISKKFENSVSIQARFELIEGNDGYNFLSLCSRLNITLEFGVQSTDPSVMKIINRYNNLEHIKNVIKILNKSDIDHQVSLMYGIPGQTIESFKRSLEDMKKYGCKKVIAYPLKLIRGTELWKKKDIFHCIEENEDKYGIPLNVSCDTFTKSDWILMNELASELDE